jgi:hypothetical protein
MRTPWPRIRLSPGAPVVARRSRGGGGEVVGAGRSRRRKLCSGSSRRYLAPPEIGTGLSVGFGLTTNLGSRAHL